MELSETAVWVAPSEFAPAGAEVGLAQEVLLWSRRASYVILLDANLSHPIRVELPTGLTPISAGFSHLGSIEVLSADPPQILTLSDSGEFLTVQELDPNETILGATRGEEGWLTLVENSDSQVTLGLAGSSERVPELRNAFLSSRGPDVILTESAYPFSVRMYDRHLDLVESFSPLHPLVDTLLAEVDPLTVVSLATLPLASGFVQTLSDLTSDRRVIVRYDEGGKVENAIGVTVPLGLTASCEEGRFLIAVRRTNDLEVLKYQWRRTTHE